jgi:hypothetical protein
MIISPYFHGTFSGVYHGILHVFPPGARRCCCPPTCATTVPKPSSRPVCRRRNPDFSWRFQMGVSINGTQELDGLYGKTHDSMDDLGVLPFQETSRCFSNRWEIPEKKDNDIFFFPREQFRGGKGKYCLYPQMLSSWWFQWSPLFHVRNSRPFDFQV